MGIWIFPKQCSTYQNTCEKVNPLLAIVVAPEKEEVAIRLVMQTESECLEKLKETK